MAPGAVPGSADRRRCDGGCALLGGNASCVAAAAYHVPLRPLVLQGAASSKPKLYTQCALFEVDFGKTSAASVSASSRFSATYPAANAFALSPPNPWVSAAGPSSPFRVSACAARTLNVTGQSRVTLSLLQEHF